MKKLFLLSICILVSTSAAFSQAKFSGIYLGVASPVRFTSNATERVLIEFHFYPDGYAFAQGWSYELDDIVTAEGTINGAGKFSLLMDNGGLLKGSVVSGVARGSATGTLPPRYTFAALRRFKAAYDPRNPPERSALVNGDFVKQDAMSRWQVEKLMPATSKP